MVESSKEKESGNGNQTGKEKESEIEGGGHIGNRNESYIDDGFSDMEMMKALYESEIAKIRDDWRKQRNQTRQGYVFVI